jgi:hypothetical protein
MNENIREFTDNLIKRMEERFQDRIADIKIEHITEHPWWEFALTFKAYAYFSMRMNYDRGFFGWIVENGKYGYSIPTTVKELNEKSIDTFLDEMKQGIELRIPDEYLKSKEWL